MPKWTLGSLKAHYDAILGERDRRYEQRFADAETATRAALAAAEKAVTKAEASADKRFEGVNEFRQALSDQTATFILVPRRSRSPNATPNGCRSYPTVSTRWKVTAPVCPPGTAT